MLVANTSVTELVPATLQAVAMAALGVAVPVVWEALPLRTTTFSVQATPAVRIITATEMVAPRIVSAVTTVRWSEHLPHKPLAAMRIVVTMVVMSAAHKPTVSVVTT